MVELRMSRPPRILIVDDNAGDRELLRSAIAENGWNAIISESSTGSQTITLLRRLALLDEMPDLILMDYLLHNESCLSVIPLIRGMAGFESVPIIVLSTSKPPEVNREQIYAAGVLKVLLKAYDFTSLLKMVGILRKILTGKGDISKGGSWISDSDLALLGEG